MSDVFSITGNVGVALNAEPDSTIHLHLHQTMDGRSSEDRHKTLLHLLLKECTAANSKHVLEEVALAVYGNSYFKNLSNDQLRALIEVAQTISDYREDLLNHDLAMPTDQARTCPQCSGNTWKATQLCKHCGMDLFRHDRKLMEKTMARRQLVVVLGALGLAGLLFFIGSWIPSNYKIWPIVTAVVVLLFAAGAMKG